MCGIVGYVGKNNALTKLIQGLKKLEYRGYDSAGISYLDNGNIIVTKSVGRVATLEEKIDFNIKSVMGIGHTRWATHGKVNENNTHPHKVGDITIVHNGIIENYQELRKMLIKNGYKFKGDTDTEVAATYIDYLYRGNKDIIDVLDKCINTFKGSYAICLIVKDINDKLFVLKKDSPLVVMYGNDGNYIASDVLTYSNNTIKYFPLDDKMVGSISQDNISLYKDKELVDVKYFNVEHDNDDNSLGEYSHYMLKEINEQVALTNTWYRDYFNSKKIDSLIDVTKYNKIHIVGCGTAYHAGMVGKYLLEYYSEKEVNVFIASEYRYNKIFIDSNTLVIFISQSGETADTIACIKKVREYNAKTLGIVNVKNSTITKLVNEVIYTNALSEVAVASTKAYTAQVYVLSMLALKARKKEIDNAIKNAYLDLPKLISKAIKNNYENIINLIYNKEHIFYLGRGIDYVTMMEGALKLKEISYIHSEAMAFGELKHGTISLMNESSIVIVMATDSNLVSKTVSNIKEVKSRGSKVILLLRDDLINYIDDECYDELILMPKTNYLNQAIVNTVYLQMIAYETAKKLGRDIDKPRNLAKSVTVE